MKLVNITLKFIEISKGLFVPNVSTQSTIGFQQKASMNVALVSTEPA